MKKLIGKMIVTGALALVAAAATTSASVAESRPKYVFFFLGDGMANSQIQVTEAYLATVNGGSATNPAILAMNKMLMRDASAVGMQTTYDEGALITDSASAGTAFACGIKTKSGVVGMNPSGTESYYSVANGAAAFGKKVGIISSVSLDHATPASYYANVPNRNYMNKIAYQLTRSGFHFFGGGGFASPTGPKVTPGDTSYNIWNELADQGYTVKSTRADIMALTNIPADKVVCINPWLQDSAAMPYAIDRPAGNVSLAEMTKVAIECMKNNPEGFFLMVEGGKIDWSCHANDAMATIGDMLDFDDAIAVAAEMWAQYPDETLIIVTGDHETGGMTVGHAQMAYSVNYNVLTNQKCSFQSFGDTQWKDYKITHPTNGQTAATMNIDDDAKNLLETWFGLVWNNLAAYDKERLESAYDKALKLVANQGGTKWTQDAVLYGTYEPFVVTVTHILNEKAGIGWTSYSHTGVPVPVFAHGPMAWYFNGFYDNTDIAKKIVEILGYYGGLPVTK